MQFHQHSALSRQADSLPRAHGPLEILRLIAEETQILRTLVLDGALEVPEHPMGGAELELCLVDARSLRPRTSSLAVLQSLSSEHWVKELGGWNMECNIPPFSIRGSVLDALADWLNQELEGLSLPARTHGTKAVLAATLCTMQTKDLSENNLTAPDPKLNPDNRYQQMNTIQKGIKTDSFSVTIDGNGTEREVQCDSIILAATATGFQPHFFPAPQDFVRAFNISLALAPLMAALSSSSPVFLGQDSGLASARLKVLIDSHRGLRFEGDDNSSRFYLGEDWISDIVEPFEQNLLTRPLFCDPLPSDTHELANLRRHNGTCFRFVRPVYDVQLGIPHVRIENRVMDVALSVVDNVANLAFLSGLLQGLLDSGFDPAAGMNFELIDKDFTAAMEDGLVCSLHWKDNRIMTARDLARQLLPVAEAGLVSLGIEQTSARRFINIIKERVESGTTGSEWIRAALQALDQQGVSDKELQCELITAYCSEMQTTGVPVHQWGFPVLNGRDSD